MEDNYDSGIGIEKKDKNVKDSHDWSPPSDLLLRRQQLSKRNFKSLTVLNERESSENLQKIRRRNESNRRYFFSRGLNNGEKRCRKKYRKKFERSNASEGNIRKATSKLVTEENDNLVNVVDLWKVVKKSGKGREHGIPKAPVKDADVNESELNKNNSADTPVNTTDSEPVRTNSWKNEEPVFNVLERFEKLDLVEDNPDIDISNPMDKEESAQDSSEAKTAIDYSSGDVQPNTRLELNLELPDENYEEMACAPIFDPKRRSRVQWNREVDVIYYAGDSSGGRIVRRENEPLREEIEQQARRNKFIELAFAKKILSNASACQLRDPWLLVLPK